MRKRMIRMVMLACVLVVLCAPAALAESVKIPSVKKIKVLEDNWYGEFLEGRHIGYSHVVISEVTCDKKPALMIETDETVEIKKGDKVLKRSERTREIVHRETYLPMYEEKKVSCPGVKASYVARVASVDGGWKLDVKKKLNGRSETASETFYGKEKIYFSSTLPFLYRDKYLKDKKTVTFTKFDIKDMETDEEEFSYIAAKKTGQGDKRGIIHIVKEKSSEFVSTQCSFNEDGKIVRTSAFKDALTLLLMDGEKSAKNLKGVLEGYKALDYVKGDEIVLKEIGIKMKRPSAEYFCFYLRNLNAWALINVINGTKIFCMAFTGTGKNVKFEDTTEILHTYFQDCEIGEAEKADNARAYKGAISSGKGIDRESGEYFVIIVDDHVLMLQAVGRGKQYKRVKGEIAGMIDSVEFFKPQVNPKDLTYNDRQTGVRLQFPSAAWKILGMESDDKSSKQIIHFWHGWVVFIKKMSPVQGLTRDALISRMSQSPNLKGSRKLTIGGFQAAVIDLEVVSEEGGRMYLRQVYIFKRDCIININFAGKAAKWDAVRADVESMTKTLKIGNAKTNGE